ncbi:MAG: hypothetical protein Q8S26_13870 [Azonexus sp.]|nr:hypothetical protein [Azonexus sp.]
MSAASWLRQKFGRRPPDESLEGSSLDELGFVLLDLDLTGTDATQDFVTGLASLPLLEGTFRPVDLRYVSFAENISSDIDQQPEIFNGYRNCMDLMENNVVVTINPNFIKHMLGLAAARFRLPQPVGTWLDLSEIAGVIGDDSLAATSLRSWQVKMKTCGSHEHDAVYDVFAMAQLLQALLAYAEESGIETLADFRRNQSAEIWMRPY